MTGTSTGRDKPKPARTGKGRFLRTPASQARDVEAARLRSTGHTLQDIADRLGYTDPGNAYRAIAKVFAETVTAPVEDIRRREIAVLDELEARAWLALKGTSSLAAVDRVLKIQERRARLLGLDAPVKTHVEVTDTVTAEVERLAATLGMTP